MTIKYNYKCDMHTPQDPPCDTGYTPSGRDC